MVTSDRERTTRGDVRAWRTRDIVVAAVIGVAFGIVFWAWGLAYNAALPLFPAIPWVVDLMYGLWFVPAVLAPLIVRKPGAALFAESVAAGLSMLLGTVWAADVLLSGVLQGLGAELVFFATGYRRYTFPVLAVAALAAAVPAFVHDWIWYYVGVDPTVQLARFAVMAISAVVVAAGGSLLLYRSLRQSGVLEGFRE